MFQTHLILISGAPGCGKSTLARDVARAIAAVLLDKDCIDEPFSPNDRGERYSKEVEPKVLQALLNLAELNLNLVRPVILDVPWTHIMLNSSEWIDRIQALAHRTSAQLFVLECQISEPALRERLSRRGLKRDLVKLTPEGWETFKKVDRIGAKNPLPHQIVNVEQPSDASLAEALVSIRLDTFVIRP